MGTDNDTMASTNKLTVPEAPDCEWPEAWYMMEDGTYEDQKERNRLTPNKPATIEILRELGISYWKMDAENFNYPAKGIPGDPRPARLLVRRHHFRPARPPSGIRDQDHGGS